MTLAEEKDKIAYEHRLELRRIVVDKLLIGLLLAAVAYYGSQLLEGYKSDLTQRQFLMESRLAALKEIRSNYSELVDRMLAKVFTTVSDANKEDSEYLDAISKFINRANATTILFSPEIGHSFNHHVWLHEAVARHDFILAHEHEAFVSAIAQHFDDLTTRALWQQTLGVQSAGRPVNFSPLEWTHQDIVDKSPSEFFEANWDHWRRTSHSRVGGR